MQESELPLPVAPVGKLWQKKDSTYILQPTAAQGHSCELCYTSEQSPAMPKGLLCSPWHPLSPSHARALRCSCWGMKAHGKQLVARMADPASLRPPWSPSWHTDGPALGLGPPNLPSAQPDGKWEWGTEIPCSDWAYMRGLTFSCLGEARVSWLLLWLYSKDIRKHSCHGWERWEC